MTRELAIQIMSNYDLNFHEMNGKLFDYGEVAEAFDMAIKSLEAWEKVRAEIKDIKDLYDLGKEDLSTRMFLEGVETVEQIIDKYKAESEVPDEDCD